MKAIKVVDDPKNFQLLADETRRRIISLLRAKDMTVSEIASTLEITPQGIYHHIKKLLKADLITVTREERVGHLIESYYRASAEAFLCTVGSTQDGKDFYKNQMRTVLNSLVDIGFNLEFTEEDVQLLIRKKDEQSSIIRSEEFEEKIEKIGVIDTLAKETLKDLIKQLLITDEEFEQQHQLKKEFREILKSFIKNE